MSGPCCVRTRYILYLRYKIPFNVLRPLDNLSRHPPPTHSSNFLVDNSVYSISSSVDALHISLILRRQGFKSPVLTPLAHALRSTHSPPYIDDLDLSNYHIGFRALCCFVLYLLRSSRWSESPSGIADSTPYLVDPTSRIVLPGSIQTYHIRTNYVCLVH